VRAVDALESSAGRIGRIGREMVKEMWVAWAPGHTGECRPGSGRTAYRIRQRCCMGALSIARKFRFIEASARADELWRTRRTLSVDKPAKHDGIPCNALALTIYKA